MALTIGILGGMGPEATNLLCQEIVNLTPAQKDQEHIPFIVINNPQIPDRTQALLYNGESPIPSMLKSAKTIESAGADFIILPCNTAHNFIPNIQSKINIPFINMIEETAKLVSMCR